MKYHKIFFLSTMILLIILVSIVPQSSSQAANIDVNTDSDIIDANSGICGGMNITDLPGLDNLISLREAICAANGTAGADTISFAGNYSITLAGSQLPAITSDITITGNGIGNTIIQASTCNPVTLPGGCIPAAYRVLEINSSGNFVLTDLTIRYGENGISNSGTLSIKRCSISDNSSSSGIRNSGTITSITDSTISGNHAGIHSGEDGGGINNWGTITTISNSTFSGNSAFDLGGAIANHAIGRISSIDTISHCTFSNNSAGIGGGINNRDSIGTIDNSTFSENDANHLGGGIYNNGTMDSIANTTIDHNESRLGGGLFNNQTITTITHSTFDHNRAVEGGGIYNNDTIATIVNTTFSRNSASDYAGGIYNLDTISTINNSTFYGNYADDFGGGIYNSGAINNIDSSIVVFSHQGGNCRGTAPLAGSNNFTGMAYSNCWSWPDPLNYLLHLGSLADNGGPTETHALLSTTPANPAINSGPASCANPPVNDQDQRGVIRSNYGNCDIGAFEYTGDDTVLAVITSDPADGSTEQAITQIRVTFNKDVVSGGGANAADNTSNYLLVEDGTNALFDTQSCQGGLQADDSQITIQNASYDSASFTATLTLNPSPLPVGKYRLFVCGTTSIYDLIGLKLNGGLSDSLIDFTTIAALPGTGFAPYQITPLSEQPGEKVYTSYSGLWLEIPRLGLEMDIVGVPVVDQGWDVAWLGDKAGYLVGSAFPTWKGNTVLTAHVWDAWNQPGPFAKLKTLQHGDQFYIHAFGQVHTYEVRDNYLVHPDNMNVLAHSDYDLVTLLTCERWSMWTGEYSYRRAVQAVLIDVSPE